MKLLGSDKARLQSALLSAFPKQTDLEQLTTFHLGISLDSVAQGPNLSVVVFRLIEWAESHGRIEDLVEGAKARNPNNPLLKQFTISVEDESGETRRRVHWAYLIPSAVLVPLVVLPFIPQSTTIEASITTTRAVFAYRPTDLDENRGDSPLLNRVHAGSLNVSSFDAIEIKDGLLFRGGPNRTWVPVNGSTSIRIKSSGNDARATFTDVWIHQFTVRSVPTVYATAIETSDVGIEFVVENETNETSALTLEYTHGHGIDFTCVSCSIDSATLERDRRPQDSQEFRITGNSGKRVSIQGRPRRIEIELIPSNGALGGEQFPIETARFCEGDPQALQAAIVTFDSTPKKQLSIERRRSAMIVTRQDDLLVLKGFDVLRRDGDRPAAFAIHLSGSAKDVRVGPSCTENASIIPSRLSHYFRQLRSRLLD